MYVCFWLKRHYYNWKNSRTFNTASFTSDEINRTLEDVEPIKTFAKNYAFNNDVFYIGRSLDYNVALEGSLKLKEISYIHAEAYAAGELKHGTLALIESGVPVIALATQKSVYEKTLSNIKEVKARMQLWLVLRLKMIMNLKNM